MAEEEPPLDHDMSTYLAHAFQRCCRKHPGQGAALEAFKDVVIHDSATVGMEWHLPGAGGNAGLTLLQVAVGELPPRRVTPDDVRIFLVGLHRANRRLKQKKRDIQYFGEKLRRYDRAEKEAYEYFVVHEAWRRTIAVELGKQAKRAKASKKKV